MTSNNQNYQEATSRDPLSISEDTHYVDDLTLASILLTNYSGQTKIVEVRMHPYKPYGKIYYFSNPALIMKVQKDYLSGQILTDPYQTKLAISELKNMVPTPQQNTSKPSYTSTQYLTPRQTEQLSKLQNQEHISGNTLINNESINNINKNNKNSGGGGAE